MRFFRKVIALLFICPLLVIHFAQAQTGHVLANAGSGGSFYTPYGEPTIGGSSIYVLGFPTTGSSGTTNSLVDCSLVGVSGYNVYEDSNSDCYVLADSSGNFALTGTFHQDCSSDSQIVYFEAVGGNVGGTSNPALALLAVPPSEYTCGYIYDNSSSITLYITDFTNVIAAYTAGVFAQYGTGTAYDVLYTPYSSFPYISLNDTAVGVVFDAANAVVPIYTGFYAGTNTTVEYQLNTVADVIGSCISGTSTDCQTLFDNTAQGNFSTTEPANTWQAMLSIAQDPTGNVANQYALIASTPPWSPYNSGGAPSSWAITQSTTTPIISSIASATPPGPANAYNITGYNLADCTTSTYPTVVYNGSNAPVGVPSSCVAGTSNIIATPPPAGSEVVGVFLEGDFSNLLLLP